MDELDGIIDARVQLKISLIDEKTCLTCAARGFDNVERLVYLAFPIPNAALKDKAALIVI